MLRLDLVLTISPDEIVLSLEGQPQAVASAAPELEADRDTRRIVRIGQHILRPASGMTDRCRPMDPETARITDPECIEMILRHLIREVMSKATLPLWGLRLKPDVTVLRRRVEESNSERELLVELMRRLGSRKVEVRWE